MAFLKTLIRGATIQRLRTVVACCLVFSAVFSRTPAVRCAPPNEYQVKAAFLFNFAKFVVWPSNAFSDANTPLVIGVLGHDPFGSYLDDIIRGERADNRQLAVERYRSSGEIKNCHVLFISRSESGRLNQIVSSLKVGKSSARGIA